MSAAAQQLRERIGFTGNTPMEIQLEGDGNPAEQEARDGSTEYRYFLAGRRIMWVPAEVHQAIQRAQAGANAQFALTKHKAPKPWTVIHLDDEPAAPQPAPSPAKPQSQPRTVASEPEPTTMYTALCAAIRIASEAEKYAQQIGRPLAFETGDIRAMAASMYIHATGGR